MNQYISLPLTTLINGDYATEADFVAGKTLDVVLVDEEAGLYFKMDMGELYRDTMKLVANGEETEAMAMNFTKDSYVVDVHGGHIFLTERDYKNFKRQPVDLRMARLRTMKTKALIKREVLFAETMFKTGVCGKDLAGVAAGEVKGTSFRQFDDINGDGPYEALKVAKSIGKYACGKEPRTFTVNNEGYLAVKDHPDTMDRMKTVNGYFKGMDITPDLVAKALDLDNIYVGKAMKNDAKKGAADNMQYILGKGGLLTYKTTTPSKEDMSFGYRFGWANVWDGANNYEVVRLIPDEKKGGDELEYQMAETPKIVTRSAGIFLNNIIS